MPVAPISCGRVVAFIDGLNVYHALDEKPSLKKLKWLDYWKLCERILEEMVVTADTKLSAVKWCTAYYHAEGTEGRQRHKDYGDALESTGVETVLGVFKRNKEIRCKLCQRIFTTSEEKQTDVNIASCCVAAALTGKLDTALLVTGDTDLLPLFRVFKECCPKKGILVAFPPGRKRSPKSLKRRALRSRGIKPDWFAACQLPDPVLKDGRKIYCPSRWS